MGKRIIRISRDFEFGTIDEHLYETSYNLFLEHNNTITNDKELFGRIDNADNKEDLDEIITDIAGRKVFVVSIYTHGGSCIQSFRELETYTLKDLQDNLKSLVITPNLEEFNFFKELFNEDLVYFNVAIIEKQTCDCCKSEKEEIEDSLMLLLYRDKFWGEDEEYIRGEIEEYFTKIEGLPIEYKHS